MIIFTEFHIQHITKFLVRTAQIHMQVGCDLNKQKPGQQPRDRAETGRDCRWPCCAQGRARPRRNAIKAQVVTTPQTLQDNDTGQRPGWRGRPRARPAGVRAPAQAGPSSFPTTFAQMLFYLHPSPGANILSRLEWLWDTEGTFPSDLRWRLRRKQTAWQPSFLLQRCGFPRVWLLTGNPNPSSSFSSSSAFPVAQTKNPGFQLDPAPVCPIPPSPPPTPPLCHQAVQAAAQQCDQVTWLPDVPLPCVLQRLDAEPCATEPPADDPASPAVLSRALCWSQPADFRSLACYSLFPSSSFLTAPPHTRSTAPPRGPLPLPPRPGHRPPPASPCLAHSPPATPTPAFYEGPDLLL